MVHGFRRPSVRGLPGPRGLAARHLWRVMYDPIGFLEECGAKYGGIFAVRTMFTPPMVVVSDAEGLDTAFRASSDQLHGYPASFILLRLLGSRSFVFKDGEPHREARRQVAPYLGRKHGPDLAALICGLSDQKFATWSEGDSFPLQEQVDEITLRSIVQRVVGFSDRQAEETLVHDLLCRLGNLDEPLNFFFFNLGSDRNAPWHRRLSDLWPPSRRAGRVQARLHELLEEEIDRKLSSRAPSDGSLLGDLIEPLRKRDTRETRKDLLHLLNLLILTGHESAATSTSWLFYELLSRPDVMGKIRLELDAHVPTHIASVRDVESTPFLDAAIHESFRRNPVVPVASRTVMQPMTVAGYEIPVGASLLPCMYLAHRDPKRWGDPLAYRPERFLGRTYPQHDYFPFGGGTHRCIGSDMGFLQVKCMTIRILQQFDLALVNPKRPEAHFDVATIVPRGGVPVRVRRRRILETRPARRS